MLVSVTPDFGTTQTIIHEKLVVRAGITIRRTGTDFSNATGGWLWERLIFKLLMINIFMQQQLSSDQMSTITS